MCRSGDRSCPDNQAYREKSQMPWRELAPKRCSCRRRRHMSHNCSRFAPALLVHAMIYNGT